MSLLETMAVWGTPQEKYRGRTYKYFIAGEAFDWLLLAERLCSSISDLVPPQEMEDLLCYGRFPASFDLSRFKSLLGMDKYRGYLNYYYGVTVEEALHLATEIEIHKHCASNGIQYRDDFSEEAFVRIYGVPRSELLETFRDEMSYSNRHSLSLSESKNFTYWLFKYRMKVSDKARTASDTQKGLNQLQYMAEVSKTTPHIAQLI